MQQTSGDGYVRSMVLSVCREWSDDEGWGVLDSPETPGGCWTHFSSVEMDGYRFLLPGQQVELTWEAPGQEGYNYRAAKVDLI